MSRDIVIWTIGNRMTASTRLRIHQYLPLLAADGIRPVVREIPKGFLTRWLLRRSLPEKSLLLIQKKLLSDWELSMILKKTSRVLYDVDDAVFLDGEGSTRNRDRYQDMTRIADRVIAGNETLAKATARPERVVVLPTPVDTDTIQPAHPGPREPGLAVWIGSRTNLPNLDRILPLFGRIHTENPKTRLLVVANLPPHSMPDGVEFESWSLNTERLALGRATVGIMPLEDTAFNHGKCGFKILLYQAAGLAVVASPVGVNTELVRHGEDGYLAQTQSEWEAGLHELLGSPETARRYGDAGRERVVQTHSIQTLYPRFRDVLLESF